MCDENENLTRWICNVVGEDGKGGPFQYPGSGCALDKNHIITARHVVLHHAKKGLSTTIIRQDGVFDGEIVFESEKFDIAILKAGRKHPNLNGKHILKYPTLSVEKVFIGQNVEFFTHLNNGKLVPHHIQGTVKAFIAGDADIATRFELSNAVLQQGISGTAVFNDSDEIIGIVVEGVINSGKVEDMALPINAIPRMSPILAVRAEITNLLQ